MECGLTFERKYCFVTVEFVDDPNVEGRTFWYLCPFREIDVGSKVLAPLGRHNGLQQGVVRGKRFTDEESAPYPLSLIKKVVKIIN